MSTTTPTVANEDFFDKIWDGIKSIFSKGGIFLKVITKAADTYVNTFKNLESSQIGQFIESVVEGIDPALTPAIQLVHNALPKILADLNLCLADESLPPAQAINDALGALATLKAADPVLYAGTLNTINAKVQTLIGAKTGTVITTAQALLASPVMHDPSFGNIVAAIAPNSPVAPVLSEAAKKTVELDPNIPTLAASEAPAAEG